jgi:hypothetical protein
MPARNMLARCKAKTFGAKSIFFCNGTKKKKRKYNFKTEVLENVAIARKC